MGRAVGGSNVRGSSGKADAMANEMIVRTAQLAMVYAASLISAQKKAGGNKAKELAVMSRILEKRLRETRRVITMLAHPTETPGSKDVGPEEEYAAVRQ